MVQPPVPPPPPSAIPPPPPPAYQPAQPPMGYVPPPKRKGSPVWTILGCGCLVLLLVTAAGGYFGYKAYQSKIAPELKKAIETTIPPPTTTAPADKPAADTPAKDSTPPKPASSAQPGKQAALKAALAGASGWVGKVQYASDDWQRVKVWVGPPESEFVNEIVLQWDTQSNAYQVESTAAIPEFDAPAEEEAPPPVIRHRPRRNPATPPVRRRIRPEGYNPAIPPPGPVERQ